MTEFQTPRKLVIRATEIHKSFSRGSQCAHVLRGVDMQVVQGERVYLVGPSGSGKSTLLAILGCVLTPDSGSVQLLDQDVGSMNALERTLLRRERIGFVFQRFHLVRGLSALENVCVPLLLRGERESWSRQRGRELLADVGLADFAASDPRRMSGGQCQRVAIARALAADPDLIFADEPTASLDDASGQQIMELFSRLVKERNKTAIVVTHDVRIFPFADRILQVQEGRLAMRDDPKAARRPLLVSGQ